MNSNRRHKTIAAWIAFGGLFTASCTALAQDIGPNDWLSKMVSAVQTTNYEGTVIRLQNGTVEVLKITHMIADGVIHEKVVTQEGNGLEIIRIGNEVQCILPDKRSVLVEEWNDRSTLFSALPSSDIRFGNEYDVSIVRTERVAGRQAVLLAIRPHDEYRFGHRLWLDKETGFPLQTKLIDGAGETIAQIKFADINLEQDIPASAVTSSISTEDFRWFVTPKRTISHDVHDAWGSDDLPAGFRAVSVHTEELPGRALPVTHILLSDGLANVSVFIEADAHQKPVRQSKVGISNSYSLHLGEYRVLAVGEVPAATVERIATSMRPR